MNDRHPSGIANPPAPDATSTHYVGYGGQGDQYGAFPAYADPTATAFDTGAHGTAAFASAPFDGGMTGSYDTTQWSTGGQATVGTGTHQTPGYDGYDGRHHAAYDTGSYDTTAWATADQQFAGVPGQAVSPDATGQWDAQSWHEAAATPDPAQQWEWGTGTFDTGAYDATQWNSGGSAEHETHDRHAATAAYEQMAPEAYDRTDSFDPRTTAAFEQAGFDPQGTAAFDTADFDPHGTAAFDQAEPFDAHGTAAFDTAEAFDQPPYEQGLDSEDNDTVHDVHDDEGDAEPEQDETSGDAQPFEGRAEEIASPSRAANRSRRRPPAKRSALLTVAVPSVCVMGVAGIAAASVGMGGEESTTAKASTAPSVKPSVANRKLDSQLDGVSADANDFMGRASRTQERIDLKAQQVAEQKKAAAEAALRERLRPKFALPVLQRGLSAYFGQAGINWMSVHTGIDFPVSYGTTVLAATDGTVRTQWNSAYGNMLILTAKDGTETWYCHLSSYRVISGSEVKAGQPIAYSGNSGNSTGPHLHFEVRPNGGSAIDPLPWLRSHGLNPT
ncbi:M23 family metallopeptidase [Streptomyces nodosus]|uniref:M23 family metallopeptidase n=1 Tax=Streptomyces nodosus TaxID=40318 RepID=A0A0B5DFX1_9ACTN|nr:M23 family metallopeptidase [Streptomyces nodosus]AJE42099.1 peptidase M23 [Streptomyces nodosus]MBB4793357.1 hypothetical protein [Streptomyces nodosus]QEV40621.1 M23 family metallopeptidase [Streptomyces nodosus]